MKKPSKRRKNQYRVIYDLFWSGNPRIYIKTIASILHIDPRTAGRILSEATDFGYATIPQIRRRSHANMKEYIYFLNCKDPLET